MGTITTRRRPPAPPRLGGNTLSEAQLDSLVKDLCVALHLERYHTHDSRRSEPGYPDLTIVGPGGVMFRELKTQTGRVRPDQTRWLAALVAAGANARIWRPSDWMQGVITAELKVITRKPRPVGEYRCGCRIDAVAQYGHRTRCPGESW